MASTERQGFIVVTLPKNLTHPPIQSPMLVLLNEQRVIREEDILARLVYHYNDKSITEKEAFLALAEIVALRNLIYDLSKG
jgi:hypothetical protein